jgi:predicted dehydrogenase
MSSLKCAIVGLGKVGILFDQEPGRTGVWTHFTAYERLQNEGFDLVAVCDPDPKKLELAKLRRPALRTYEKLEDLLAKEKLDIVTLSSPTELHGDQVSLCAGKVRGIFCEKPLAMNLGAARAAQEECSKKNTFLAVNYYKRWDLNFPIAKNLIVEKKKVGKINFASVSYTGPLDAVGSHAVDLMVFFFGMAKVKAKLQKNNEMIALLEYKDFIGEVRQLGPREKFLFDLEVLGDRGKLRITDNGSSLEFFEFSKSSRYSGYEELKSVEIESGEFPERFLPLYRQLQKSLQTGKNHLESDGESALMAQEILGQIEEMKS